MKIRIDFIAPFMAFLGYFAVIGQFIGAVQDSLLPSSWHVVPQFISYFTIQTNLLTATFFAGFLLPKSARLYRVATRPGTLTAISGYILVVGLVYQVALRQLWNPTGFARVVDEMLHTAIPTLTLVIWFLFEQKSQLRFGMIRRWMIFPMAYVVYTFIRGMITDKYPYPFVDVVTLGYPTVIRNALVIILLFVVIFSILVMIGRRIGKTSK